MANSNQIRKSDSGSTVVKKLITREVRSQIQEVTKKGSNTNFVKNFAYTGSGGSFGGGSGTGGGTGAAFLFGAGVPDPGLGNLGDAYLDTTVSDFYNKQGGGWVLIDNFKGDPGVSFTQYDQVSPSASWIISHSIGRLPGVQVFDSSGNTVLADVTVTTSLITVTFASPQTGSILYG